MAALTSSLEALRRITDLQNLDKIIQAFGRNAVTRALKRMYGWLE